MKKEQVLFVVVVLLLFGGKFLFSGDSETNQGRRSSRGRGSRSAEVVEPSLLTGRFLSEDAITWGAGDNDANPFLAPRETTPLEPVPLGPSPFPRLRHPGNPTVPPLGGKARVGLRHALEPDPSIVLPPPVSGATSGEIASADPEDDGSGANAEPEVEAPAAANSGEALSLSEYLSLDTMSLLKIRTEEVKRRAPAGASAKQDSILWPSGRSSSGSLTSAVDGLSMPQIKFRFDGVRKNTELAERDRRTELTALRFVFMEDRGPGRPASRVALDGTQVEALDLADTPLNRFELRRLDLAAREKTGDVEAQLAIVRDVYAAGEYLAAATHLEKLIGEKDPRIAALAGDAYMKLFDYGAAFRVVEAGLEHAPDNAALLGRYGELLSRLGIDAGAENAYRKVLASRPADPLASLGLGRILARNGEVKAAIPLLRQAEGGADLESVQRREARLLLGEAELLRGDLGGAESWFQVVADTDAGNVDAAVGLAVASFARGNFAEALTLVEAARANHQFDGRLAYISALALLRTGEYVKARDTLLLVPELDPLLTAKARIVLSYLMEKTGQDEAALAEVDRALRADPVDASAHMQRARVLLNLNDLAGAREEFLYVLRGDPDRADALAGLGDVAFHEGQFADAIRYYDRTAELEPDFPDLLGRRIVCQSRNDRLDRAQELLSELSNAQLADPFLTAASAYVYYKRGNADEALQRFRRLRDKKLGDLQLLEYATQSAGAIEDNLNKSRWRDEFNRTGTNLLRGWERQIGSGVTIALVDRGLSFQGRQQKSSFRPTYAYQKRPGRGFSSFSVKLTMEPHAGVFSGCGVVAFSRGVRSDEWDGWQERNGETILHGIQVALAPEEQGMVYRIIAKGKALDWVPMTGSDFKGGEATVTLEVVDRRSGEMEIRVNGRPATGRLNLPELTRWTRDLDLQIFTQATLDQSVKMIADDVEIITEKP